MFESDGGKYGCITKMLNHWPIVIGQERGEIQNSDEAVGIDDLKPMTS